MTDDGESVCEFGAEQRRARFRNDMDGDQGGIE